MEIRNNEELRTSWITLDFLERACKQARRDGRPRDGYILRKVAERKKEIREYNRKKQETHIVKLNDDGSYVELVSIGLPVGVYDKEFAEEVFVHDHYIEMQPSAYDCTGRAFTTWYKLFERNGWWYAYHGVAIDV